VIPILYSKGETTFTHNGLGLLTEALACPVTEERNGKYELTLDYPITGQHYSEVEEGSIVKSKPNETSEPQLFRLYKSSKPINGIVTFYGEHISYELNGIPIIGLNVTGVSASAAINTAFTNAILSHSFTVWSDIATLNGTTIKKPCSLRAILGGQTGSILDVWGGEYEFDNFLVKLHAHRGKETNIIIEYGKNLTDIKQERNIADCYTHFLPYAIVTQNTLDSAGQITATEDVTITLTEGVIALAGAANIGHAKTFYMDFTQQFSKDETISEEALRAKATAYVASSSLGVPKVNITASFVQLWQTEEYKNIAPLERVKLCDTVTVKFSELGISATAEIIKTVFDSLKEQYTSVELGDAKSNFANTIAKQQESITAIETAARKDKALASAELSNAILTATNLITGQNGGYVVLNPPNNPQEILIMDTPDLATAVNVWRWNSGGLGYSSNGYNGEYALAITMNGAIVADAITSGILNGALLKADSVQANAISQYFKSEITNEINNAAGVVEQAFTAADGQVKSIISEVNTVLTGDIETANTAISELRQTVEALDLAFTTQYTGGINNVLNSSGLNGVSDDWTYTGAVIAQQTADAVNNTLSSSMFRISAGNLSQEIRTIEGAVYTLTLKAKKDTASRTYFKLDLGGNEIYVFDEQAAGEWTEYSKTFTAPSSTVAMEAGTTGSYLYVADIMLAEGTAKTKWTPAPNEIYTTNVKIDRRGINITNSESSTETIIDNTQFAVKHQGATVLTVNKDLTTLRKTEVTDELTIGKGKFVPKTNGLDFVLLD